MVQEALLQTRSGTTTRIAVLSMVYLFFHSIKKDGDRLY